MTTDIFKQWFSVIKMVQLLTVCYMVVPATMNNLHLGIMFYMEVKTYFNTTSSCSMKAKAQVYQYTVL